MRMNVRLPIKDKATVRNTMRRSSVEMQRKNKVPTKEPSRMLNVLFISQLAQLIIGMKRLVRAPSEASDSR